MHTIILDGKKMTSRKEAHSYLKETFNFPDYYGENLDALWDMLTCISEPIKIGLINEAYMMRYLGRYGGDLIGVFEDIPRENLNVRFEREKNSC